MQILFSLKPEDVASVNPITQKLFSAETASQADINEHNKREVIARFQRKPGDTGSPEVQVAILTTRILYLTEHMNRNRKDMHSRRGLLVRLVSL